MHEEVTDHEKSEIGQFFDHLLPNADPESIVPVSSGDGGREGGGGERGEFNKRRYICMYVCMYIYIY